MTIDTDSKLDNDAFEFFKLFARYEATLKDREFYTAGTNNRVNLDWDRFSNEVIGRGFLDDLGDHSISARYILDQPPMRQTLNEANKIIWSEVDNSDQSPQALFAHIRRIRNNLYHGAKFNGTWFDPERSSELLQHALVILKHYSNWLNCE